MKQVVQDYRTGELRVEELSPPALRRGGVLVRTACSLISAGTERQSVETAQSSLLGKARSRPDLVRQVVDTVRREGVVAAYEKVRSRLNQIKSLGYSAAGTVTEVGGGVRHLSIGDNVACAGAGYASHAEVIFVPENLCARVPSGVAFDAACYTTLGSIALHGVRQSDARLGECVAVIGLGLVGQLTVQILKAAGCVVLGIDISADACGLALGSGADRVASDYEAADLACAAMSGGRGADAILITASTPSSEPVELAARLARDRARVVVVGLVGMTVPRDPYYNKELEVRLSRSYGPGRYDPQYEEEGQDYPIGYVRWTEQRNMEGFLSLIAEGKVRTDLLTTHRFAIDDATRAYDLITGNASESYCGVLLEYPTKTAAIASPTLHLKPVKKSQGSLGIGFIGAGGFARGVLLPAVRRAPETTLIGVAAATGVSSKNTAEQFGFAYAETDYRRILEDSSIDCVFIATRHDSHAKLAAEALENGKHVFLEKPLAIDAESLRAVSGAAAQSGRVLMVGYNRRFAPLAVEVAGQFSQRAGPMNVVYRVNAGAMPANHWTLDPVQGGGRLLGEVCHFVDFAQFVTGESPVAVFAAAVPGGAAGGFVDDSSMLVLRMSRGSIASIVYAASGDRTVPKERIEIFCDGVVATIDDFRSGSVIRRGKRRSIGGRTQDKGHAAEIRAFLHGVRVATPPISLDSLVATSLTCLAAVESIGKGTEIAVNVATATLDHGINGM